jgi:hypothetical protein
MGKQKLVERDLYDVTWDVGFIKPTSKKKDYVLLTQDTIIKLSKKHWKEIGQKMGWLK